ncbi:hypothetical protein D3C74_500910 [compost metagenome]
MQTANISDTVTKHNICTATGHVGCDGHGSRLSGLGNDLGLGFMMLGVQHLVLDSFTFQHFRYAF